MDTKQNDDYQNDFHEICKNLLFLIEEFDNYRIDDEKNSFYQYGYETTNQAMELIGIQQKEIENLQQQLSKLLPQTA